MSAPLVQTIGEGLIAKLNLLRLLSIGEDRSAAISQVAFSAQHLRNVDPAGYLGVQGMLAALRGDVHGIREVERKLLKSHADELQEVHNLARSFIVTGGFDDAVRVIAASMSAFGDVAFHPQWASYMLLLAGNIDQASEAASIANGRPAPPVSLAHTLKAQGLIRRLNAASVNSEMLRAVLDCTMRTLTSAGWPTPAITLQVPSFGSEDAIPAIILCVEVDGEFEAILNVEDELTSSLIREGGSAYADGRISCCVTTTREASHADFA